MNEPQFRPVKMTESQRGQFIQKAKADRLAFEAAELLSRGETERAATLASECRSLAGQEQSAHWVRHYATTRFKVTTVAVDAFLGDMPPVEVAL